MDSVLKPPGKTEWDIPPLAKPEGYLFIDHRASPGIPATKAREMGLPPEQVKEGKIFEAATLACVHCLAVFVKNPLRTRDRGHCYKCNGYICDACEIASKMPDYIHISRKEVIDKVTSGKYVMTGTTSLPHLKEIKDG